MTFRDLVLVPMKIEELEKEARKASLTPRQYCLREIIVWKDRLRAVSDDYRGLDGKEFAERVEREVDSFIREESERNNE